MRRGRLIEAGQDTNAVQETVARSQQEQTAVQTSVAQGRGRAAGLGRLGGTTTRDAPDEIDEEARLREIPRELGEAERIDAEFLESLWREAEAEEGALLALPELQAAVGEEQSVIEGADF